MNKRVLVTGSTKGIGQGILKKFHDENWDICITGRDSHQVLKIQNNLNEVRNDSAIGLGVDLGLKSDISKLFDFIKSRWGGLDCLVLNIGSGSGQKGLDTSFESNYLSVKINFADVVNQFRVFSQLLENNKSGGDIIFIGSIAQASNVKAPFSYSYSKRAISIFARHQALRLAAKKIAVNVINPGHIMTDEGTWSKRKKESLKNYNEFVSSNIPTGIIGEVENVAELVFSLTNQKLNTMLTGENINIDGGTTINF
jgi:NAD(P)-dependent dehydrogenase (short-subunit alcohol dehydrogenase family)